MNLKNKKILLGLYLVILGFLTHFLFIWQPAEVVFDEVHYGKAVNGYLRGEYFFTGHPPLGVQLITLGAWLGGYQPHFNFEHIGEKFIDKSYIALRFMPNLAGSLIPLVVYIFAITLGIPTDLAFLIGIFLTFENAFLVQSHFILIDSFLILFGFLGLILFFVARKRNYNWQYFILMSLFLAMSFSVKWSGLSFIIIAGFIALWDLIILFRKKEHNIFKRFAKLFICFFVLPLLVYSLTFYIHFKLLPKSGPGDAFMSKEFRNGEKNFIGKFIELNKVNYYSNVKYLTASHPYSSKFFTWPLMTRPIFYWINGNARIYLLGNPIIWWLSTLAVFLLIIFIFIKKFKDETANILLLGYALNLLPFISITTRTLFLYHYLSALIFAIIILVYLISKNRNSKIIFAILLIFSLTAFLYFVPLTYGFNLTPQQYENRVWLNSWR